jgi:hypothetical protein
MISLRAAVATIALGIGAAGTAPAAHAGHVVVGIGIGLPGVAIAAPIGVVPAPYYYGPAYYGPAWVAPPLYYGYYGRPYYRYAPRGYARGYGYAHHYR